MAKLVNLARMTTATTGTGTITLGTAKASYLSFASAGVADGDVVAYGITDGANSEIGYGTYTASGTTLTRNVRRSTNSNAPISLSGSAEVFITAGSEELLFMAQPGGRLTITTGTPVLTTTTSAQTTVYYTPRAHCFVPLWTGSGFQMHDIGGELSQATTDTTKSPAACTTNSNYDLFVWLDGTTYRCTRGPLWSSSTARGTGAGTTELERVQGVWVNKVAITNGPAARFGTYVGSVRTNGSSQIDVNFGALASGGTAALIGIWNAYNQVPWTAFVADTTDSWSQSTAWANANGSATMRVSVLSGLAEGLINAEYWCIASTSSAAAKSGIGYDTSSAFFGVTGNTNGSFAIPVPAKYTRIPELGWHYFQAIEYGGTGTAFYGDANAPSVLQSGLFANGMY